MDFISKIEYHSKVVPGAVVTLRRVTATTRAAFEQSIAKYRTQIREIQRERKPLADIYKAALDKARAAAKIEVDALMTADPELTRQDAEKRVTVIIDMPDEQFAEHLEYANRERRIHEDANLLSGLRAQFVSIDGFTIAGKTPDIDTLISDGPEAFTRELATAANEIAGLDATERGESPWPGTSPHQVDGPNQNTTAISANSEQEAA